MIMNTLKSLVLVGLLSLGALPGTSSAAPADNHYAVVTIRNPGNATITYQFRWGPTGQWTTVALGPRTAMAHYYPYQYANQNSSPTPEIRFHYNPGEPTPLYKTYRLVAYAAPYAVAQYGKPYTFKYYGFGKYLDLYNGF
jgi:hypothetical protein